MIHLVATSTPFLWIKLIQFQDVEAIYDDLALLKEDVTEMKNGNMSELISSNLIINDPMLTFQILKFSVTDLPLGTILAWVPRAWTGPPAIQVQPLPEGWLPWSRPGKNLLK